MQTHEINNTIFEDDWVVDQLDGTLRQISGFVDHGDDTATVYLTDGGVMSLSEILPEHIHLDSEIQAGNAQAAEIEQREADELEKMIQAGNAQAAEYEK